MLELRPVCENCNKSLSASSIEAMICSYECTFCKTCVTDVLENVCPNCGGGFCQRPNRPQNDLQGGNYLVNDPASTLEVYKPVDVLAHKAFSATIKRIRAHER